MTPPDREGAYHRAARPSRLWLGVLLALASLAFAVLLIKICASVFYAFWSGRSPEITQIHYETQVGKFLFQPHTIITPRKRSPGYDHSVHGPMIYLF